MWITSHEASKRTGYSESHLRRLAREGFVKARKREGRWYFDWEVLQAYMDGWITIRHASQLTGYSESHLRRLAREGFVKARMQAGVWLFDRMQPLGAVAGALHGDPIIPPKPPKRKAGALDGDPTTSPERPTEPE